MTDENAPEIPPNPTPHRLLRAKEAARFLGYTTGTVRNMASQGTLPSVKLPTGGLRFRLSELEAWAAGHDVSTKGVA